MGPNYSIQYLPFFFWRVHAFLKTQVADNIVLGCGEAFLSP